MFEDIKAQIKKNPAIGIVLLVVGVGLFLYLKNSVSAASASTATPTPGTTPATPTGFAPSSGGYTLVENIHQTPAPTLPPPAPTPKPPTRGIGKTYLGPNPWLTPPPPSVNAASWNPYQYNTTIPTANQWPRPRWYNAWWSAGNTSLPPGVS